MIRKMIICAILVIVVWGCYMLITEGFTIGEISIANYTEIQERSKELETSIAELETKNTTEYSSKKTSLQTSVKNYQERKEEYETMLSESNGMTEVVYTAADVYNIDFLWTIIGNYATEEGIELKFDVVRSISVGTSEVTSGAIKYIICDLKFTVNGSYIGLTDFIYDIEDDDRLGFEITGFSMEKSGDNLKATFSVNGVPVNSENISTLTVSPAEETEDGNTTNTSNTTNTTNTNNTINT